MRGWFGAGWGCCVRGPGVRPGGRVPFLCFAKEKAPKERRPRCGGPAAPDCSALLASGGVRANSLRSDMRGPCSARPCAARRPRGDPGSGDAFASLGYRDGPSLRSAFGSASAMKKVAATQGDSLAGTVFLVQYFAHPRSGAFAYPRSGPSVPRSRPCSCSCSCSCSCPCLCLCFCPRSCPCPSGVTAAKPAAAGSLPGPLGMRRGAQGQAEQGPHMFERSEFVRTPPAPSTAGCPERSAGSQTAGSPFFGLLFFGEAKKSDSPAGANSRPRKTNQPRRPHKQAPQNP